jgi:predicted DNA-binding transcriptional regulator YafY
LAIRQQNKLTLNYRDQNQTPSERIVWPFALGFFDQVRVLIAWCELRQGFRHFRTDRIAQLINTEVPYPTSRQVLLQQWRELEGIER